jgi:hypothetical protein
MPRTFSELLVAKFLRDALAAEAVTVPKLEGMARAAGLLGPTSAHHTRETISRAKRGMTCCLRTDSGRIGDGIGALPSGLRGKSQDRPPPAPKAASNGSYTQRGNNFLGLLRYLDPYPT